jgi:hypothetical protein
MATSAMYYPHIHFRSRSWLRSAILYYDRITRIVPDCMTTLDTAEEYSRFSRDAKALADDVIELTNAGFIHNQTPDSASVTQTADEFLAFASNNLTDPVRRAAVLPALRRRNPYISVHPSKIDPGLAAILRDLGLAHVNLSDRYSDLDIDAATAVLYLMNLSINMSNGRPVITDNVLYQKLLYSNAVATEEEKTEKPDGSFVLVAATFENVVPENLEDIPLRQLLEFREIGFSRVPDGIQTEFSLQGDVKKLICLGGLGGWTRDRRNVPRQEDNRPYVGCLSHWGTFRLSPFTCLAFHSLSVSSITNVATPMLRSG